jgi:hypothetical protein
MAFSAESMDVINQLVQSNHRLEARLDALVAQTAAVHVLGDDYGATVVAGGTIDTGDTGEFRGLLLSLCSVY